MSDQTPTRPPGPSSTCEQLISFMDACTRACTHASTHAYSDPSARAGWVRAKNKSMLAWARLLHEIKCGGGGASALEVWHP